MSFRIYVLGAPALALLTAVPHAHASDKRDFEACDGRLAPGKTGDGMAGEAPNRNGFPAVSLSAFSQGQIISACTTALFSPRLQPTQGIRRAHLLRARAAAYLERNDTQSAIADLDAAEAATSEFRDERFFARSMGVSFSLLRAAAHVQQGKLVEATSLAAKALELRPYSLPVQMIGYSIANLADTGAAKSPAPYNNLLALEPDTASTLMLAEYEAGRYDRARALVPLITKTWPTLPLPAAKPLNVESLPKDPKAKIAALMAQMSQNPDREWLEVLLIKLNSAYILAATGDPAGARATLAETKTQFAARFGAQDAASGASSGINLASLTTFIDARTQQIETRIALAEGRPADALKVASANLLPQDRTTQDLVTALKAALPGQATLGLPDSVGAVSDTNDAASRRVKQLVSLALIAPETPRALIDYQKARPNILGALVGAAFSMGTSLLGGIDRTAGFRSITNSDGTITVEYLGNTLSPSVVQEMTLLRAAELTREGGKQSFTIVDRKDYTRRMNTTRYNVTISSVTVGYKTELRIRTNDSAAASPRDIDATRIIDALGPLYYEEKKSS
jgi:hypothetical protein